MSDKNIDLVIRDSIELFEIVGVDKNFDSLQKLVGISDQHFAAMYRPLLASVAEAIQLMPASETHHHARHGGLLDHTIEMTHTALKIRRGMKLPIGGTTEQIFAEKDLWTYAMFVAAMLHDIGKAVANFRLRLESGSLITPLVEDVATRYRGQRYEVEYCDNRYQLHKTLSVACLKLVPEIGLAWLAESSELFYQLTSYLSGNTYESGVFAQVVSFADRDSTARDIRAERPRFAAKEDRQIPAIEHFSRALRTALVDRKIKINQPGSIAFVDEKYTYFVCRKLVDFLVETLEADGVTSVPRDYVRVYDLLLEHGLAVPHPADEHAAIWSVRFQSGGFDQTFSVLAFETSRLFLPARMPMLFDGVISVANQPRRPEYNQTIESMNDKPSVAATTQPESSETTGTSKAETAASIVDETDPFAPVTIEEEATSNVAADESSSKTPGTEADKPETATTDRGSLELSWDAKDYDLVDVFVDWIGDGIKNRKLKYNSMSAAIHIVDEGVALLTPEIFKRFCLTHGLMEKDGREWDRLQKRIDRKKINIKTDDGRNMNVHRYWAVGERRKTRINCYILPFDLFFKEGEDRPTSNKFLVADFQMEK